MKKILIIALPLFLVVIISFSQLIHAKPNMDGKAIEIYASYFGKPSITTLNTDKRFNIQKSYVDGTAPINKSGSLNQNEYDEFISYLRSTNIMHMSIKQKDDRTLICEGVYRITIAIDGKINNIESPCVGNRSAQTEKVMDTVRSIEDKLSSLLK